MSVIRLLALQCQLLKQSATRVVNLTQDEAMTFVKSCTKYSEVKPCSLYSYFVAARDTTYDDPHVCKSVCKHILTSRPSNG